MHVEEPRINMVATRSMPAVVTNVCKHLFLHEEKLGSGFGQFIDYLFKRDKSNELKRTNWNILTWNARV